MLFGGVGLRLIPANLGPANLGCDGSNLKYVADGDAAVPVADAAPGSTGAAFVVAAASGAAIVAAVGVAAGTAFVVAACTAAGGAAPRPDLGSTIPLVFGHVQWATSDSRRLSLTTGTKILGGAARGAAAGAAAG